MFFNKITSKRLRLLAMMVFIIIMFGNAEAESKYRGNLINWGDKWQTPRGEARLNVIGKFSDKVKSRLQGVSYDAMEQERLYYLYLGAGFQFGKLELEPVVGWSFRDDEWITGLRLYPKWKNWRAYSNLEYQLETQFFYYLAQFEVRVSPLIELGFEVEGRGEVNNHLANNGIGLNVIFNLHGFQRRDRQNSKLRVETAIQYRELNNQWKPQALVRLVFTPEMKQHSRSKRKR